MSAAFRERERKIQNTIEKSPIVFYAAEIISLPIFLFCHSSAARVFGTVHITGERSSESGFAVFGIIVSFFDEIKYTCISRHEKHIGAVSSIAVPTINIRVGGIILGTMAPMQYGRSFGTFRFEKTAVFYVAAHFDPGGIRADPVACCRCRTVRAAGKIGTDRIIGEMIVGYFCYRPCRGAMKSFGIVSAVIRIVIPGGDPQPPVFRVGVVVVWIFSVQIVTVGKRPVFGKIGIGKMKVVRLSEIA